MSDSPSGRSGNAFGVDVRVLPLFLAGAVLVADGLGVEVPPLLRYPSYAVVIVGSVVTAFLLLQRR